MQCHSAVEGTDTLRTFSKHQATLSMTSISFRCQRSLDPLLSRNFNQFPLDFARKTCIFRPLVVSISSDFEYVSGVPVVLVLVSKSYVTWKVTLPSETFPLAEIFVVDATGGSSKYVTVETLVGKHVQTSIQKSSHSIYGFGQDIESGQNTPNVIRLVESNYGKIRSFSGCFEADRWSLVIKGILYIFIKAMQSQH